MSAVLDQLPGRARGPRPQRRERGGGGERERDIRFHTGVALAFVAATPLANQSVCVCVFTTKSPENVPVTTTKTEKTTKTELLSYSFLFSSIFFSEDRTADTWFVVCCSIY